MQEKPAQWTVVTCLLTALAVLMAAVYFGGTDRIPLAMVGTVLFIALGGLGFELARRRSV